MSSVRRNTCKVSSARPYYSGFFCFYDDDYYFDYYC